MKPHARSKAARRVLSPDEDWARAIRMRIIADTHPRQRDGVMDPAELIALRIGRGGTKTTTMRAREIIKLTTLREQRLGFAATSKDQARDLMWPQFKRACEAYELRTTVTNLNPKPPDLHILDAKLMATCVRTGSELVLRGVEDKRDAEKFRGFPQAEFDIDEAGSFPPELLRYLVEECVQPRIAEGFNIRYLDDVGDQIEIVRGGCIVMGSTPPAQLVGLFYEATKPSGDRHRPYSERAERDAEWSSHAWTLKDVVDLPDADRYPALQALWAKALERKRIKGWDDDHPVWRREYLGEWAADYTTTVFRLRDVNLWRPYGERMLDGMPLLEAAIRQCDWSEREDAIPGSRGEADIASDADMEGRHTEAAAIRRHAIGLPDDVGHFHFVVTIDTGGTRDPYAVNVFAFAPSDPKRRMFHVFCLERHGLYAKLIAELLLGPEAVARILRGEDAKPYDGIFGRIGWPDGIELDGDQAIIDELSQVYGIGCKKSDRRADYKFGAVEMVNGDLLAERILIIEGTKLHEQMLGLQWRADEFGRLKEHPGQPNHCTDCLIYAHRLVATLYDTGVVTSDAPVRQAFVDPMGLGAPALPGVDDQGDEQDLLAPSEWVEDDEGW